MQLCRMEVGNFFASPVEPPIDFTSLVNSCMVFRLMFIDLKDIHWDVRGLRKIVSGEWGSADFSELLVGTIMPLILGGDYRVARIDKTMPRPYKPDGLGSAAGVPDLLMSEVIAPSTWRTDSRDGKTGYVSVSVKRFKMYRKTDEPYPLAKRILLKAYKGLNEYLSVMPIPGPKFIVVLVENKHDAGILVQALEEVPQEYIYPRTDDREPIQLRIVVVDTCPEIKRMVFHYTPEDARRVQALMPDSDGEEPEIAFDLANEDLDTEGFDFSTLDIDWATLEKNFAKN